MKLMLMPYAGRFNEISDLMGYLTHTALIFSLRLSFQGQTYNCALVGSLHIFPDASAVRCALGSNVRQTVCIFS